MTNRHPSEGDLALLAGGDCGRFQRLLLNRHLGRCGDCRDTLASFGELRSAARNLAVPELVSNEQEWNRVAGEMRANIRLGLAAGECVAGTPVAADTPRTNWKPRFALGVASVVFLLGAGVFLHGLLPHGDLPVALHNAVLESTGKGVELRTASGSMTLLNQTDATVDQTVTSQGAIRASNVDGNTGTVTITSVYVE